MKAFREFGAFLILLIWAAVPAMVCATPGAQMTESERTCCKLMKMSCGSMDMPSSHGCCHKEIQADNTAALHARITIVQHPASLDTLSPSTAVVLPVLQPAFLPRSSPTSPPQSPPPTISVLRI